MNTITTKYKIGDVFNCPRSTYKYTKNDEIIFNGKTYSRQIYEYVPSVKKKTVVEIKIRKDNSIVYGLSKIDDIEDFIDLIEENKLVYYTEEEAMKIAQEYANKETEYYGEF